MSAKMPVYRVTRDGTTIDIFSKEADAKRCLRQLKLDNCSNGYLDRAAPRGQWLAIYQKLTTKGKLLECF